MAAWMLVNLTEPLREAISSLQVQKGKEPWCTQGSAEQGEVSRRTPRHPHSPRGAAALAAWPRGLAEAASTCRESE